MHLNRGINLGGFLSQCEHKELHYQTFIDENDIKQIAEWGFDHVRVPVDYEVVEAEDGQMKEAGYGYIDNVVKWSKAHGLNMILDLHKAYGYDFNDAGDAEKNNLFSNEALQQRFVNLWKNFANRYGKETHMAFELLNEVVEEDNVAAWNQLIEKAVSAIREITKDTYIIYGGIRWNSASTLQYLEKPKFDNIIFTFHFYEPLLFTHQKAHWVAAMDPNQSISYPVTMEYYKAESEKLGAQGLSVTDAKAKTMGPEFITERIEEAIEAAKNAGVGLYCGEFGVIDQAPIEDTLRWFEDVDGVFRAHNIGCAVWSYKKMDFGFIDAHYDDIRKQLLELWTGK